MMFQDFCIGLYQLTLFRWPDLRNEVLSETLGMALIL